MTMTITRMTMTIAQQEEADKERLFNDLAGIKKSTHYPANTNGRGLQIVHW